MNTLRSPLAHVRGLGSAKDGVAHWWAQRLTSIALVPLAVWFVISALRLIGTDYAHYHAWLASPGNATMMVLFVATVFNHAVMGLQVIFEDYVHDEGLKALIIIVVKFLGYGLGTFSVVSVLKVAFGG